MTIREPACGIAGGNEGLPTVPTSVGYGGRFGSKECQKLAADGDTHLDWAGWRLLLGSKKKRQKLKKNQDSNLVPYKNSLIAQPIIVHNLRVQISAKGVDHLKPDPG
jgi:hypothetical protein